MIRRQAKYINFDDNKLAFRLVLKGKHIGYFKTLEEAVRQRNIYCVKLNMKVPNDVPNVQVPITVQGG